MTGVLTNKWNWSSQAPMAGDQFSVTCLPKFWFRQFAELWPLTLTCAIRQLLVTQKLSYSRKRYLALHSTTPILSLWCPDNLGGSVTCDLRNDKLGSPIIHVRIIQVISVVPSPPYPISGHNYIGYLKGIYMDLWEVCETPARDLRAMFTIVYGCEHCLRNTCEPLACDLRVRPASTCVHLRAGVTSCEQPMKTLGSIFPQRRYF